MATATSAAPVVGETFRLSAARFGQRLSIEVIEPEANDECRLRELGLYEGAAVEIVTHGDPVVLSVFGNRYAICRRCARHVVVRLLPPA